MKNQLPVTRFEGNKLVTAIEDTSVSNDLIETIINNFEQKAIILVDDNAHDLRQYTLENNGDVFGGVNHLRGLGSIRIHRVVTNRGKIIFTFGKNNAEIYGLQSNGKTLRSMNMDDISKWCKYTYDDNPASHLKYSDQSKIFSKFFATGELK